MSVHKPATQQPASLTRIVRRTLLGMALSSPLTSIIVAAPAWAQTAATRQFDIPSGSVDIALAQFSATAGVNISFDPPRRKGSARVDYTVPIRWTQACANCWPAANCRRCC